MKIMTDGTVHLKDQIICLTVTLLKGTNRDPTIANRHVMTKEILDTIKKYQLVSEDFSLA